MSDSDFPEFWGWLWLVTASLSFGKGPLETTSLVGRHATPHTSRVVHREGPLSLSCREERRDSRQCLTDTGNGHRE